MSYYNEMLTIGQEFQDFCSIQFAKIGIPITNFSSKKYQYENGENLQGYEFKYDRFFRNTGNLWIELKERTTTTKNYCDSGILRNDNTIFYVMGDYDGVFLMQKNVLKQLAKKYKPIENTIKTSFGYLLPVEKANLLFNYIEFHK